MNNEAAPKGSLWRTAQPFTNIHIEELTELFLQYKTRPKLAIEEFTAWYFPPSDRLIARAKEQLPKLEQYHARQEQQQAIRQQRQEAIEAFDFAQYNKPLPPGYKLPPSCTWCGIGEETYYAEDFSDLFSTVFVCGNYLCREHGPGRECGLMRQRNHGQRMVMEFDKAVEEGRHIYLFTCAEDDWSRAARHLGRIGARWYVVSRWTEKRKVVFCDQKITLKGKEGSYEHISSGRLQSGEFCDRVAWAICIPDPPRPFGEQLRITSGGGWPSKEKKQGNGGSGVPYRRVRTQSLPPAIVKKTIGDAREGDAKEARKGAVKHLRKLLTEQKKQDPELFCPR